SGGVFGGPAAAGEMSEGPPIACAAPHASAAKCTVGAGAIWVFPLFSPATKGPQRDFTAGGGGRGIKKLKGSQLAHRARLGLSSFWHSRRALMRHGSRGARPVSPAINHAHAYTRRRADFGVNVIEPRALGCSTGLPPLIPPRVRQWRTALPQFG